MRDDRAFTVLCTVSDGKLKLFDRAGFDRGLTQFGDGEELELHVEAIGRHRTHAQNAFFHGPVLQAFVNLGMTRADAKAELCLRFLPSEVRRLDGTVAIVPGHTSTLSIKAFNELLDSCIQLAAELGELIEDADRFKV